MLGCPDLIGGAKSGDLPVSDSLAVGKSRLLHNHQVGEYFPLFSCGYQAHNDSMTDLFEQAIERVRALPPETQDDFARVLLSLAGDDDEVIQLTPEEEASLAKSLEQAERGEFATDEQVQAIWAKHGL